MLYQIYMAIKSASALSIDKVSFSYGRIHAVDDLSLVVPCGISFGLLGPNGSGKTTLIRLLVGLLKPKTGTIQIMGNAISRQTANLIGYMPQLYSLYLELSVWQNLEFFARIYGLNERHKRQDRIAETIKLVGLWERRNDPVVNLSGGMRQRVSLACAIVHNPPLLFLDEPTVGLDPELRINFWNYFKSLTQQGTSIVISSHTMDDAIRCDRLAFLREGKVIAEGSPTELIQATAKPSATLEDAFLYYIHRGVARA